MLILNIRAFGTSRAYCAAMEQARNKTAHDYRNGLVNQIARDMQTLSQLAKLGYCAHPGGEFYAERIATYQQALTDFDQKITDRETSQHEGK